MSRACLLGLDLGTSSLKALLLGEDGAVLGEHAEGYATRRPKPGWSEQDPEDWWQACVLATRAALEAATREHGGLDVRGIGLSGQMHTFVLVDRQGSVVRPAVTWMDTRAQPLLERVRGALAAAGLVEELANPVVLGLSLPPLVWLREHEPAALEAAHALLVAKDALRLRLTGALGSEPTDASATLLLDVGRRVWSERVARLFDLPLRLFPPLAESHAAAGALLPEPAAALGLPPGIAVAHGAGDQQAAAVAMGTLDSGQVQLMVGTGAQVLAVRDRALADPQGRLHAFCHVTGFVQQASVNNAGAALSWVRELLGLSWPELYRAPLTRPDLPAFVPFLTGERTPLMKGYARGAWLGLSPAHDREALAAAAVVGVIVSIADAVATVAALGAPQGPIRASGGGLREPGFAQAVADAVGAPLTVLQSGSASAVGAALLGGVAAGVYPDVAAAVASLGPRGGSSYVPDVNAASLWAARSAWRARLDAIGLHELIATRPQAGPPPAAEPGGVEA